jgi:gamma-glutamyltranspeptidase/glutathione hydrolase
MPVSHPVSHPASPRAPALAVIYMSVLMLIGPFLHLQFVHISHDWRFAPKGVYGDEAMVVSAHFLASEVGAEVLRDGGNAFDAAVAVNFALAVVYQQAGNIGGGGFMVYRKADGDTGTLDFRERAPFKASRDMYLDADGAVIKGMSLKGPFGRRRAGQCGRHGGAARALWQLAMGCAWCGLPVTLAQEGFVLTEKAAREL